MSQNEKIVAPSFDESVAVTWDEAVTTDFILNTAYARMVSCELSATAKGAMQVAPVFEFLEGENKGRLARKWVQLQTISPKQTAFMKRDLALILGDSVKVHETVGAIYAMLGHIEQRSETVEPDGTPVRKPFKAVPSDAFLSLVESLKNRVVSIRVAAMENGFPKLQLQHYKPIHESVAAWKTAVTYAKRELEAKASRAVTA